MKLLIVAHTKPSLLMISGEIFQEAVDNNTEKNFLAFLPATHSMEKGSQYIGLLALLRFSQFLLYENNEASSFFS